MQVPGPRLRKTSRLFIGPASRKPSPSCPSTPLLGSKTPPTWPKPLLFILFQLTGCK